MEAATYHTPARRRDSRHGTAIIPFAAWQGGRAVWRVGVLKADGSLDNLAGVTYISLRISSYGGTKPGAVPWIERTVPADDFTVPTSADAVRAGTEWHAEVQLAPEEMLLPVEDSGTRPYWYEWRAVTEDGETILSAGQVIVRGTAPNPGNMALASDVVTEYNARTAADAALDGRLTGTESGIVALDERTATAESAITTLEAATAAAGESITTLESRADTADSRLGSGEQRTGALEVQTGELDVRVASVEQSQSNGHLGYLTRAALYADLTPAAGAIGEVTNDSDPNNNGTYIKSGASGAGSWQQSSNGIYGDVSNLKAVTAPMSISTTPLVLPDGTVLALTIRDQSGRVGAGMTMGGVLRIMRAAIGSVDGPLAADSLAADSVSVGGGVVREILNAPGWALLIRDAAGRIGLGVRSDGEAIIPGLAIPGSTPGSITTAMLADAAVTTPKLDLTLRRRTATDLMPVMPDDVRPQLATVGVRTTQSWQPLPDRITPVLWGTNSTGTALEFRPANGLLVRGLRRVGTYDPSTVGPGTNYRGSITTSSTWPPTGTFANGDYYHYTSPTPRTIGSDTLNLGDLMVRAGGTWVYQASPGSGTSPLSLDWWSVTAAGTYEGIVLAVGDRLVYAGYQSAATVGWQRWRRGRPDAGEFFRMGDFNPASGLPSSPVDGDMWEASAAGTAGGLTFAVGDTLIRTGGAWGRIAEGAVRSYAAGAVIHLPCVRSAREWVMRRADKSMSQVGLALSARGLRRASRSGDGVLVIGDSMAAQPGTALATLISPRVVTTRSYGGGRSRDVLAMAEWLISNGDPDAALTVIAVHGQNSAFYTEEIEEVAEALARLCGTSDQRIIHVSMLGTRSMTWDGTRLVSANHEEQLVEGSSNLYAKFIRYLRDSWPDQYIDFRAVLCAAAAADNDPSVQWPGKTNAQVASLYGIPPLKWCRTLSPAGALDQCVHYVGEWSTAGLPTGGSHQDYYLRTGPSNIGRPIVNISGTWTEITYDVTHLSTEGDSHLAAAMAAKLTANGW